MSYRMRVVMKSGYTFDLECEEMKTETQHGDIVAIRWEQREDVPLRLRALDIDEVAAVLRVGRERKPPRFWQIWRK